MKTIKSFFLVLFTVILAFSVISMVSAQPSKGKPWDIPAKYKEMKNAVKTSDASVKAGDASYKKNCASCHGKAGAGDGTKAKTLETFPGNFANADFQNQTDGTIFYQIKFGRMDMPKYDKKIEDAEIWNIVNYIRTLKK